MPDRPRVLLVDDHPGVVRALTHALSHDCDVVGTIADAGDVADVATRLEPVVIVVDLNLANVSGLDVCRQITQNNPGARVIVISAMADDAIRGEALAAGALAFFHKSAVDELVVAIKNIWAST